MNKSTLNTPHEDILSPEAATQLCGFELCLGLECPNAKSNDSLFMQVTAALVSNHQENVLFPTVTANLGLILSPLKGIIISNSLLQVAIEIVHKLRINCGMMLGAWMRCVIRLISENPAAVPVDLFPVDPCCWSHTVLASRHVLVCLCPVSFHGFF
jgi:hypothetical protein